MNYLYYPGCSLTGTAREYNTATAALMTALGAHLLYSPFRRNGSFKGRVARGRESAHPWWMLQEGLL